MNKVIFLNINKDNETSRNTVARLCESKDDFDIVILNNVNSNNRCVYGSLIEKLRNKKISIISNDVESLDFLNTISLVDLHCTFNFTDNVPKVNYHKASLNLTIRNINDVGWETVENIHKSNFKSIFVKTDRKYCNVSKERFTILIKDLHLLLNIDENVSEFNPLISMPDDTCVYKDTIYLDGDGSVYSCGKIFDYDTKAFVIGSIYKNDINELYTTYQKYIESTKNICRDRCDKFLYMTSYLKLRDTVMYKYDRYNIVNCC